MSLFFSMLELKFAIYYRAASLPSQASYARPGFLQTLTAHQQFLVRQSCIIITFHC